jgi:hypothetical protein
LLKISDVYEQAGEQSSPVCLFVQNGFGERLLGRQLKAEPPPDPKKVRSRPLDQGPVSALLIF